jgi:2-polyprenyl-6-methoxyphenol hydroxylase-like FAD-dependent oxidoreductase
VKRGLDRSNAAAVRDILLKELDDWSVELKDLIRNRYDTIITRLIYALPNGHSQAHSPGVTVLGDAAHVMSPCVSQGANLPMLDATELALAIAENGDDIETALAQHETAMFPRCRAAAEKSAQGLEMCFAAKSHVCIKGLGQSGYHGFAGRRPAVEHMRNSSVGSMPSFASSLWNWCHGRRIKCRCVGSRRRPARSFRVSMKLRPENDSPTSR